MGGAFDEVVGWTPVGEGVAEGAIPESWMQGRAAFGGAVAAVGCRALAAVLPADRAPRSLTTAFLAPVQPGAARCTVEVLRAGRHLTHAEARITQGDRLCAIVSGAYGAPRPSGVEVVPPSRPERPDPDTLVDLPYIEGFMPAFTQHMQFRWTDGEAPFSGADRAGLGGWVRHRTRATGLGAVMGLLDAWPAPVLPMVDRPTPASTVRWTVHLVAPVPEDTADGWWWYRSEARTAHDGYCSMLAELYHPDGHLVAWTEQLVAVFDAPSRG